MKPKCPECESEYLDQGKDGGIFCHGCKVIFRLYRTDTMTVIDKTWLDNIANLPNAEY